MKPLAHNNDEIIDEAMVITIIISTMDGYLNPHISRFDVIGANYIIVNQGTPFSDSVPENVNVINDTGLGLSRSRNVGLSNLEKDGYFVICDNDNYFSRDLRKKLLPHLQHFDVVTFNNMDASGPIFETHLHTRRSLMSIPSWCISGSNRILDAVEFDERFGLGATFNSGEENIFLIDSFKKGFKIKHIDENLVFHEGISTGFIFNETYFITKGAMLRRMFGVTSLCLIPFFVFRKFKQSNLTLLKALFLSFRGFILLNRS